MAETDPETFEGVFEDDDEGAALLAEYRANRQLLVDDAAQKKCDKLDKLRELVAAQRAAKDSTCSVPHSQDHEPLEDQREPREPLPKVRVFLLNIMWYGTSTMFLVLSVVVVPAQIETMIGSAHKGRWLGGMVAGGAVMMFLSGPLVGMVSDRLVSRHGKRRPVMLGGMLVLCIGLVGMAVTAPQVIINRPMNQTGEGCHVDLVAQRCRPYQNHTVVPMLHQQKGSLPQQAMAMPEKKADLELAEQQTYGNIGLYVFFYLIVATSFTVMTVPYNALVADKSHPEQRGLNSGVMGFMILFGNITGAAIGLVFIDIGVLCTYAIVVVLMVICVITTIIATAEAPAKMDHDPISWKEVFIGYWDPLKEHDFRWVFFTRFLMQQGVSTVTGFLEYWVSDMVELPNCWTPERSVAVMLVPLLSTAAVSSIFCGIVSDHFGRRKPVVIVAAMMMFLVAGILAFLRGPDSFYVATAFTFLFGAGFGAYLAVDFALVMDVLPNEKEKAKDIAVWHQALILPQAIATPIGGVVLDVFESVNCEVGLGYIILFLITAFYFFLSGVFVTKIKGVR